MSLTFDTISNKPNPLLLHLIRELKLLIVIWLDSAYFTEHLFDRNKLVPVLLLNQLAQVEITDVGWVGYCVW